MLRYAILCRVSTDRQAEQGESLEVQENLLRECVKNLGGVVAKVYRGQEHSTTGYERPILDELLFDAANKEFDAVMVYDISRWTRDTERAQMALMFLKKHNIKLYTQYTQYDFADPNQKLQYNIQAAFAEFDAEIRKRRIALARVSRAKRGWPVSGKKPFGRQVVNTNKNEAAKWEVIPEVYEKVQTWYRMYVNEGKSFPEIAQLYDMIPSVLRDMLVNSTGSKYVQSHELDGKVEITETIIPPLLTEEQIETLKETAKQRRSSNGTKYRYLLAHQLKCGLCGSKYSGNTAKGRSEGITYSYYVHAKHYRLPFCIKNISVEPIEEAVFFAIREMLSNSDGVRTAIQAAQRNTYDREMSLKNELELLMGRKGMLENKRKELIAALDRKIFTLDELAPLSKQNREDLEECSNRIKRITNEMKSLEMDIPPNVGEQVVSWVCSVTREDGIEVMDWPDESKIRLLKWFFGSSRQSGIYVSLTDDKRLKFEVKGVFGVSVVGAVIDNVVGVDVVSVEKLEEHFTSPENIKEFKAIHIDDDALGFVTKTVSFRS